METKDFEYMVNQGHQDRMKLMLKKRTDYATEDFLANFKRMQTLCSVLGIEPARSPVDCALFLVLLKIDRWCNLRRTGGIKNPRNESLRDTWLDGHNYWDLAYAAQLDEFPAEPVFKLSYAGMSEAVFDDSKFSTDTLP